MNSGDYCEMLEKYLLPYGKKMGGKNWIFQQDNASIHEKLIDSMSKRCLEIVKSKGATKKY